VKKIIIFVLGAFFLQVLSVVGFNQSIAGTIAVSSPIFMLLFIPLLTTGAIILLALLIVVGSKNKTILNLLQHNKLVVIIAMSLVLSLLLSSAFFFTVADSFIPETHKSLLPFAILGYVLGWELLIALSFIRNEFKNKPRYWIFLPILIAVNYFLWHDLVVVGRYLDEFLPNVYPGRAEKVLANYRFWELMLPIREFQGMWQFELIIVYLLENIIGIAGVWYLYQLILILVAFFLSWKVFRSKVFSYVLVMCLVFGTHLYHAFQYSSITAFYLLQSFFLLFMFLAYEFIRREKRNIGYFFAMVPTLIATAIMYEGWLDFFAGMWLVSIFLIIYCRKKGHNQYTRRAIYVFGLMNLVFLLYIVIKFTYLPFPHTSGESAMVFAYPSGNFWRGFEDIVSNYFKYLYMTLTNFLPPELVFSNALYQYDALRDHTNPVVLNNYLLYWRYFAGVAFTFFYTIFFKILKLVWREKVFSEYFPLLIFLIMTAVNGATHTLLLFRPTRIVPHAGYHVFQGVLGLSLCIAYGMELLNRKLKKRKYMYILLVVFSVVLMYSAIRRPNYLWHLVEMAGIAHQGPYPNPLAVLIIKIRRLIPGFLL
jgi:hypothetical protein